MRPKIYNEPRTCRTLRLPTDLAEAVDLYAAKYGMSSNAAVIEMLERVVAIEAMERAK